MVKKRANSAGNIRKLSGGHLEGCEEREKGLATLQSTFSPFMVIYLPCPHRTP